MPLPFLLDGLLNLLVLIIGVKLSADFLKQSINFKITLLVVMLPYPSSA